jgi:hypothetical protein
MQRPPEDMARELEKIRDAMFWVAEALSHQGQADAAMHMNPTVRLNPATTNFIQALEDVDRLILELREP